MVLQFRLKVTFVTLKHKRKEEGGKGKKTRNSELVKARKEGSSEGRISQMIFIFLEQQ